MANSKQFSEINSSCNWDLPTLVLTAATASNARQQQLPDPLSDKTVKFLEKETTVYTYKGDLR